ncbi:hypothetical protein JHE06_05235 [Carnobacterium sp. CS13]|uniref:hypothetical protein n=1 Tax=Carnobacterium sp. CS13 TaxID=2800128 RepID=UPI001913F310|nr:hypothetical protein [Carnobacterium sp. CS13]QQP71174.1 hypothetical protein JHE06_05235 [Carnobacterium sp. CS13]
MEKKVVLTTVEAKLVEHIIELVKENALTVTNTKEVMQKVYSYMEDNAKIKKD